MSVACFIYSYSKLNNPFSEDQILLGFIFASGTIWNESLMSFNSYSWLIGALMSSLTYYLLSDPIK